MTRHVFNNDMVAHVWAQQNQDSGRSGNGQFYFRGHTIFSYGSHFPIARFVDNCRGEKVVLFTTDTYGSTTAQHKSMTERAISAQYDVFHVPHVTEKYTDDLINCHTRNVESLVQRVHNHVAEIAKPRKRVWVGYDGDNRIDDSMDNRIATIAAQVQYVADYVDAFALAMPAIDVTALEQQVRDAYAKYNDPKRVKARAQSAGQREKRLAGVLGKWYAHKEGVHPGIKESVLRAIPRNDRDNHGIPSMWRSRHQQNNVVVDLYAPKRNNYDDGPGITLEQWLNGEGTARQIRTWPTPWIAGYPRPVYARRRGDIVETTQGAQVPFVAAKAMFVFVQKWRYKNFDTENVWRRNGQTFRVGNFQLDEITPNGDIKAGCHFIKWEELLRLATKEAPELVRPMFPVPALAA